MPGDDDPYELLRRSEERYRTLVAATNGFVWTTTADGLVEDMPGWRDITGQTPAEVAGRGWLDAIHPEDRERVARTWDEAERERKLYKVEYRVRSKSGGWTHLEVRGVPVREADGRVREWVGTCNVIDDRKAAEEALRESENRFRHMADHAPVILWLSDPQGACTYANPQWGQLTGAPAGSALGAGWLRFLHPEDVPAARESFLQANTRRARWDAEFRVRRADGAWRWMLASAVPRSGADGEYLGYIGSLLDVTERKRAEEVLRAEKERLERLDEAKTQFLSLVAHELRTPMTPILLQLKMLRRLPFDDGVLRRLDVLDRNMERLNGLVQQLLDVARLQSGRLPLRCERLDLRSIAQETFDIFDAAARDDGIRLGCALPEPVWVEGDPSRLVQVAINLVSNALRFTPSGGMVEVEVARTGGEAVLRVRDTGRGMEPEQVQRLFQPFTQVHPDARTGSGLGLYISRAIVEAHHGSIDVQSGGAGGGSTFEVRLPLAEPPVAHLEPRSAGPEGVAAAAPPAGIPARAGEAAPGRIP